jgi:pimeloyl-ACP methyl ester carboxylesterase
VLLPDYQIIAWDPPNQGKTTPEFPLAVNFMEVEGDYAYELMMALKIYSFSCLGWSKGGINALFMSAKHPENIEKLIFFGSISYVTQREIAVYEYSKGFLDFVSIIRFLTHLISRRCQKMGAQHAKTQRRFLRL